MGPTKGSEGWHNEEMAMIQTVKELLTRGDGVCLVSEISENKETHSVHTILQNNQEILYLKFMEDGDCILRIGRKQCVWSKESLKELNRWLTFAWQGRKTATHEWQKNFLLDCLTKRER